MVKILLNEVWMWNHCHRFTNIMNLPEGNIDSSHKLMPGIQLHLYLCVFVVVVYTCHIGIGANNGTRSTAHLPRVVTTIRALTLRLSVSPPSNKTKAICVNAKHCSLAWLLCLGILPPHYKICITARRQLQHGVRGKAGKGANENNGKGFWWQDKQPAYKEKAVYTYMQAVLEGIM